MVTAPSDQRQFPRIPISYRVKLVVEDRIIAFPSAINISLSGILVNGAERLPLGTECGVAILLEEAEAGKRVVTRGTVVRSDSRGMAIAFSRVLDANSLESLRALIRSLSPDAAPGADGVYDSRIRPCG
jgi:hypothetical protein